MFKWPGNKRLVLIFDSDDDYMIDIIGNEDAVDGSTFDLEVFRQDGDGNKTLKRFIDVPTSTTGISTMLLLGMEASPLFIDENGNGSVVQMSGEGFRDLTGDGLVNFTDFAVLTSAYGQDCNSLDWCGGTDLDRSGSVGPSDIAGMAENWLEVLPDKAICVSPIPASTDTDLNVLLKWQTSGGTSQYLYFGTTYEDVNDVTALPLAFMDIQGPNEWSLAKLEEESTYYWRVDVSNAVGTVKGDVWSFTTKYVPEVAHWTFDDNSGDLAVDSAGANDGTVSGATWTDGILGGALEFDGADDYVDCSNHPVLAPELFTISFWVHPQATSGSRTVLRKAGGDKDKDFDFELFGARNPTFSFGDGSQSVVLYSGSKIPLDEWTNIALTRAETEAAIYINGTLLMNKPYDFAPSVTEHSLIIGGGALQPFKGKIDDVQIYDSVLSDEDIESLAGKVE